MANASCVKSAAVLLALVLLTTVVAFPTDGAAAGGLRKLDNAPAISSRGVVQGFKEQRRSLRGDPLIPPRLGLGEGSGATISEAPGVSHRASMCRSCLPSLHACCERPFASFDSARLSHHAVQ